MDTKTEFNKLFIRYLKENKAYKRYQINFEKECKYDMLRMEKYPFISHFSVYRLVNAYYILSLESIEMLGNAINYAFTWSSTKEGHDYWAEKHRRLRFVTDAFYIKTYDNEK